MRVHLAGNKKKEYYDRIRENNIYILESFFYIRNNTNPLFLNVDSILLDSGAFTFLKAADKHKKVDFEAYTREYAAFINKLGIKYFFELDIDNIVGLREVERLRNLLEKLTDKKPIPVWHKSRGIEYFTWMCKNYPYVALGGIVTKEIPTKHYEKMFPWFISEAHKNGAKIHGLGYTRTKELYRFNFDSVDSASWLYGNKGRYIYKLNYKTGLIEQVSLPKNRQLKSREVLNYNFNEWVKFQQYILNEKSKLNFNKK